MHQSWLARVALGIVSLSVSPAYAAEVAPLGLPGLPALRFVAPTRPVASIISDRWQSEDSRERVGEAGRVMEWLGIRPGMVVADIGAGSGYYTVRLAAQVGPSGRVLAQDVMPDYLRRLQERVAKAGLANVSVGLGEFHDARLPQGAADVALMIHMYHEIGQPFALLANLVPQLKAGGRLGIVDVDDVTERHGTPLGLLECELGAVGYRRVGLHWLLVAPPRSEYLAVFEPPSVPPAPESVRACPVGR